jgi:hypothetical protein
MHLQAIDPKIIVSRANSFVKTFVQILSLVCLAMFAQRYSSMTAFLSSY